MNCFRSGTQSGGEQTAHLAPGQQIRIPAMEISRPTRAKPSQCATKLTEVRDRLDEEMAKHTFFKLVFAAASMIFLPVAVDPVQAICTNRIQSKGRV